jgi:hypothetical protein
MKTLYALLWFFVPAILVLGLMTAMFMRFEELKSAERHAWKMRNKWVTNCELARDSLRRCMTNQNEIFTDELKDLKIERHGE